tara:strand:+ start:810 stop:1277 length:468 start_codon:yes stop_codon:yes gene_type:complete
MSKIPVGPCPSAEEAQNANLFTFDGVVGKGYISGVYDGDSFDVVMELFGQPTKLKTRLDGLDTPELRTKDLLEKALGYRARDRVRELCLDKEVSVWLLQFEKYGRTMVRVTLDDGRDLSRLLIDERLAQEYGGQTKLPWGSFIGQFHPDLEPYSK